MLTSRRRKTLIEARIPFVIPGKQIYLPFLGTMLTEKCDAETTGIGPDKLRPSAQQLLFAMILDGCHPMPLAPLAKRFQVSAMTITRAADQLCKTDLIKKIGMGSGAQKMLITEYSPKELYQKMRPYLIQPVRKTVYIDKSGCSSGNVSGRPFFTFGNEYAESPGYSNMGYSKVLAGKGFLYRNTSGYQ